MAFFKFAWSMFALAVTLTFMMVVGGFVLCMSWLIWRGTGLEGVVLRRAWSAYMFALNRSVFGLFCFLMRITPVYLGSRGRTTAFRPAIVLSNHLSTIDICLLMGMLPEMGCRDARWVMKESLGKIPIIGHVCRGHGSALIDRTKRAEAARKILRAAELANQDEASMVLFPEGTRWYPRAGGWEDKRGGPPYRRVRSPYTGGFVTMRQAMPKHDILLTSIVWGGDVSAKTIFDLWKLFGRMVVLRTERHIAPKADADWLVTRWREMDAKLRRRT